jgi:hypothetical protein
MSLFVPEAVVLSSEGRERLERDKKYKIKVNITTKDMSDEKLVIRVSKKHSNLYFCDGNVHLNTITKNLLQI